MELFDRTLLFQWRAIPSDGKSLQIKVLKILSESQIISFPFSIFFTLLSDFFLAINSQGLSARPVANSDEIQLRIDPLHADLDEEISGLHKQVTQLKHVS